MTTEADDAEYEAMLAAMSEEQRADLARVHAEVAASRRHEAEMAEADMKSRPAEAQCPS
jgi:hypothetical protein